MPLAKTDQIFRMLQTCPKWINCKIMITIAGLGTAGLTYPTPPHHVQTVEIFLS